jgi:hypothetical protein
MFVASPDLADVVVLGLERAWHQPHTAPHVHARLETTAERNETTCLPIAISPLAPPVARRARPEPRIFWRSRLRSPRRRRGAARAEDGLGWREGGTATWYGGPNGPGPDGMSIYTGSCKYGSNIPSHYVAALNTDGTLNTDAAAWNFNSENINCAGGYDHGLTDECGACYEVMCVAGRQRGLADSALGPWAGCANGDGEKSITVLITDSCPCGHPNPR